MIFFFVCSNNSLYVCPYLNCNLDESVQISTYWLDAEEVIEIFSDCIMIRQGAEARVRRLSKVCSIMIYE